MDTMAHSNNKQPRQRLDPKKFEIVKDAQKHKEKDWTFEDILRSKRRGR